MVAKRKNSKQKGKRGEMKARDALAKWTGVKFNRTPGSGSFSTIQNYDSLSGDLYCDDPSFIFTVEVKNVESWDLISILSSDKSIFFEWWKQATRQCEEGKKPMLIFTKNRHELYVLVDAKAFGDDEISEFLLISSPHFDRKLKLFKFSSLEKLQAKAYFQ
jgi:hypothetical protein